MSFPKPPPPLSGSHQTNIKLFARIDLQNCFTTHHKTKIAIPGSKYSY